MDNLEIYQASQFYHAGFWWESTIFYNELDYQDQVMIFQNASSEHQNDNWYGYSSFAAYEFSNEGLFINLTLSGHQCSLQYE